MKRAIYLILIASFILSCSESKETEATELVQEAAVEELEEMMEPTFDSLKAYEYGADEYGMKQYVMAFLKKGPNRDRDSSEAYDLQMAHMENIGKMADEGKLVLAGPFMDDGEIRGIYIFNVKTVEEAKALTETDPAIQAGSLVMELIPWYGSAALVGVNDEHKRVSKKSF